MFSRALYGFKTVCVHNSLFLVYSAYSVRFSASPFLGVTAFRLTANVPALGEVANFGTDYFLSKIKFLAKCKREFTTKFAILPNAC